MINTINSLDHFALRDIANMLHDEQPIMTTFQAEMACSAARFSASAPIESHPQQAKLFAEYLQLVTACRLCQLVNVGDLLLCLACEKHTRQAERYHRSNRERMRGCHFMIAT